MFDDSTAIRAWIDKNRFRFPGFGVSLVGGEPNTQDSSLFGSSELRVLIVRLSKYDFVASSMSHGLMGQLSIEVPGVFVDYSFMPDQRGAALMAGSSFPPLFGITTKRPCTDFDIIAISNSVAQELANLPWMLGRSGIPADFATRVNDDRIPIIILGGANAQSAFIACSSGADKGGSLVDALYFGEAEVSWKEILGFVMKAKAAGSPKLVTLVGLAKEFKALHVPVGTGGTPEEVCDAGIEKRCRAILSDTSNTRSLVTGPVWYSEETLGYSSVAIDYGCPFLCRFCKEAWEKRPYRTRAYESITDDIAAAKKFMGLDTINLFSFNFTSHRNAGKILEAAGKLVSNVQIKSQRFDVLLEKPEIYERLRSIGKSNFTFGLEGISGRIRRFFHKNIRNSDVLDALATIYRGPVRQVKIFLIASGFEDERDLDEFSQLAMKMADIRDSSNARRSPFVLSVTPLIPMPHTPLQFARFVEQSAYASIMSGLSAIGSRYGMIVREAVSFEEARTAMFLLYADAAQSGCIANPPEADLFHENLTQHAVRSISSGLPSDWKSKILREKNAATPFPWDMLYTKQEKEKLYEQYADAKAELSDRSEDTSCSGDSISGNNNTWMQHAHAKASNMPRTNEKTELREYWFSIETGEELSGIPWRFFQVSLARQLMIADPRLVSAYNKPGKAVRDIRIVPVFGTIFACLALDAKANALVSKAVQSMETPRGYTVGEIRFGENIPDFELALIEYRNDAGWDDSFVYAALNEMNAKSVKYDIVKTERRKSVIISKQSVKKAGFRSVSWDFSENKLSIVLDVSEDAGKYIAGSRLGSLWLEKGKAFRITGWLEKGQAAKCAACGSPLVFDAFGRGFTKYEVCVGCFNENKK
jgi:hypothetical protein